MKKIMKTDQTENEKMKICGKTDSYAVFLCLLLLLMGFVDDGVIKYRVM